VVALSPDPQQDDAAARFDRTDVRALPGSRRESNEEVEDLQFNRIYNTESGASTLSVVYRG